MSIKIVIYVAANQADMFTILTGAQFGDEGKGKVIDLLAENYDIVVRFQGGDNAGHTVVVGGKNTSFTWSRAEPYSAEGCS